MVFAFLLTESDKQLSAARRGALEMAIKNSARDDIKFMLTVEHVVSTNKREAELVADMKAQLV